MNALDHVSAHLKLKDNRGRERHPGGVQFRERDRLITALSQPIQQPLLLDIKDIHRDPIVALPRRWRAGPSGRPVARAAGTGLRSRSRCPCAPTIPPPPGRYGAQRHPRSSGGPQTPAAETPAGWPSHVVPSSARDPMLNVCRRVQSNGSGSRGLGPSDRNVSAWRAAIQPPSFIRATARKDGVSVAGSDGPPGGREVAAARSA